MESYYRDDDVQLYLGDMREVLPALNLQADLIVADPPYAETSLAWDQWPEGWLKVAAAHARSMWCFGSMRMLFTHLTEFQNAGWKLSQDIVGHDDGQPIEGDVNAVWEKHNGSSFATDRFKRVHEHVLHLYCGNWGDIHQDVPRTAYTGPDKHARARYDDRAAHTGSVKAVTYTDDGTRLMRSVIKAKSVRGGINKTEKPLPLLDPLIRYGCPPGGLILDPMAGSCAVLEAARLSGRRAVGIELREKQCEAAAKRLSNLVLEAS